jgi:hypothetical protein
MIIGPPISFMTFAQRKTLQVKPLIDSLSRHLDQLGMVAKIGIGSRDDIRRSM